MTKKLDDASWQDADGRQAARRQMGVFLQWALDHSLVVQAHLDARQQLRAQPEHYIRDACGDRLTTDDFLPEAAGFIVNVYKWERVDFDTWNIDGLNARLRNALPFPKASTTPVPKHEFLIGSLVSHAQHGVGTVRVFGAQGWVGVRFAGATKSKQVPEQELQVYTLRQCFLDRAAADPSYADDPMGHTHGLGTFLLWALAKGLLVSRHNEAWESIHQDPAAYVVEVCGGALDVADFAPRARPFVLTSMPRYGEAHPPEAYDRLLRRRPIVDR